MEPIPLELEPIPAAVRELVDRLTAAGHAAYLVGGCVRDLLRGRGAADFDIATSAPPEVVLQVFANAVPIGLQHGTVMVPAEGGPVDVTSFRAGPRIEDDLAHRDFTLNALAYDPRRRLLLDPFDGRSDLASGRLRAVRSAADRFAEDPLRALRAARLAATLELSIDSELERAIAAARAPLRAVARERVRRELTGILLAPAAGPALGLLRRTRIEADLAPGAADDAGAVVQALPRDLALRLAAWLRGTRAGPLLRRQRFPRRLSGRVDKLVRLHPINAGADASSDAAVRRLIKRAGEENLSALIQLRRAELRHGSAASGEAAAAGRAGLRELEQAIDRVRRAGLLALRRFDLAIDGHEVMRQLDCGPGPHVGQALAYLTDRVLEDPACNAPQALRALLAEWAAAAPEASS
jgi:tRNA nucleotidyltransferase (CCA-adding enzyme)